MSAFEEPILARLNRLDLILKQLEEIRGDHHSPKSSNASSGTLTSDGQPSCSPERRCRPVNEVMIEVEEKGNLIDRLIHAEDRILKVCLQLEEEFESERSRELNGSAEKKSPKKGLKQFVKSCVKKPNKQKTSILSS
ncbi:uncharacterized protein LOC131006946 isoform X1 [Salvia miltiorrhiza]|uniref:uncharacterized protein LOC131006946 isoform X1 n=1 Tax=Salvia miltiorrhiza TaxID=226208 RepID=UPI0025AD074D|nr:uncharacterized protein LOC131006946 isoform X1 [Salvia miltiorrhiza]